MKLIFLSWFFISQDAGTFTNTLYPFFLLLLLISLLKNILRPVNFSSAIFPVFCSLCFYQFILLPCVIYSPVIILLFHLLLPIIVAKYTFPSYLHHSTVRINFVQILVSAFKFFYLFYFLLFLFFYLKTFFSIHSNLFSFFLQLWRYPVVPVLSSLLLFLSVSLKYSITFR